MTASTYLHWKRSYNFKVEEVTRLFNAKKPGIIDAGDYDVISTTPKLRIKGYGDRYDTDNVNYFAAWMEADIGTTPVQCLFKTIIGKKTSYHCFRFCVNNKKGGEHLMTDSEFRSVFTDQNAVITITFDCIFKFGTEQIRTPLRQDIISPEDIITEFLTGDEDDQHKLAKIIKHFFIFNIAMEHVKSEEMDGKNCKTLLMNMVKQ